MIIRHSVYSNDPWGDGGSRRTTQIHQLVSAIDPGVGFLQKPVSVKGLVAYGCFVREAAFLSRCGLSLPPARDNIRTLGQDLHAYRRQLSALPPGTVLLWEATHSRYAYLPMLAREIGIPVIGLPHNLESLVPDNRSFYTRCLAPSWLKEEIRSLAACDSVFTISREDQWLLRIHGISAGYLPYYPPNEVKESLLQIRQARQRKVPEDELLMLGTAANPPTFAGMVDRLHFFTQNKHLFKNLHVVGYGTERLHELIQPCDKIHFHGGVTNDVLHELILRVKAAVVHQIATSGALTRIPELLMAGVPVVANTNAARDFFNVAGVHIYEDDKHLEKLLASGFAGLYEAPVRPCVLEAQFIENLVSLQRVNSA